MNTDLMARVNQTWIDHFHLPAGQADIAGTSIRAGGHRDEDNYMALWPVGQHIVAEVPTAAEDRVRQFLSQKPADYRLTFEEIEDEWGTGEQEIMPLYAIDASLFRPAALPAPYTMRLLTSEDQPAFDAFLAQCSEADRDEGDVSLDHEVPFGIFDGERIVCSSSVFVWRGFIDMGILTDPSYRGQGLGKAAVGACIAHYLPEDRVIGYRHDIANLGSQKIAQALGFLYYGDVKLSKLRS